MKLVNAKDRNPDKDGRYYIHEDDGSKGMGNYRYGRWTNMLGYTLLNPQVKWLDESEQPAPSPIPGEEVEAIIRAEANRQSFNGYKISDFRDGALFGYSLAQSTIDSLTRLLEDLTPGGSEFVNDPQRCAEFIRDQQASIAKVIKPLKSEIATLTDRLNKIHYQCDIGVHDQSEVALIRELSYLPALNSISKPLNTEDGKDKDIQ